MVQYPPPGGYPPQQPPGYPAQPGGYPPQHPGYPVQPGGYPQQQPGGYLPPGQYPPLVGYGYGPPPNYLVWAILTTFFCCLPTGVVSIIFAAQVNGKYASGDIAGAMNSSKNAKTWAIVGASFGFVVLILYIIAVAALGFTFGNFSNYHN